MSLQYYYFGVCNSGVQNVPIIENVNLSFNLEDSKIIEILKGNPKKLLLPMLKDKKENVSFDFSLIPPIFEYFNQIKHNLSYTQENEILTNRKALKEKDSENVNVEQVGCLVNQKLCKFRLVQSTQTIKWNQKQYSNSLKAVNTAFKSVKNFENYTFYTVVRHFNTYLGTYVNYTAEVDGFLENRPIEFKSFNWPAYLERQTNSRNFKISRSEFLWFLGKQKKIDIGVQCQLAQIKDIIFGFHNGQEMRLEHFFLKDFIKGVEDRIKAIIDKQDRNFADFLLSRNP